MIELQPDLRHPLSIEIPQYPKEMRVPWPCGTVRWAPIPTPTSGSRGDLHDFQHDLHGASHISQTLSLMIAGGP